MKIREKKIRKLEDQVRILNRQIIGALEIEKIENRVGSSKEMIKENLIELQT